MSFKVDPKWTRSTLLYLSLRMEGHGAVNGREMYLGHILDQAEEKANRRGDDLPESIEDQLEYWAEGKCRILEITPIGEE